MKSYFFKFRMIVLCKSTRSTTTKHFIAFSLKKCKCSINLTNQTAQSLPMPIYTTLNISTVKEIQYYFKTDTNSQEKINENQSDKYV